MDFTGIQPLFFQEDSELFTVLWSFQMWENVNYTTGFSYIVLIPVMTNHSALSVESQLLSYKKLLKPVQKYLHFPSQTKYLFFPIIIKVDLNYFPETEKQCCEQAEY